MTVTWNQPKKEKEIPANKKEFHQAGAGNVEKAQIVGGPAVKAGVGSSNPLFSAPPIS